MKEKNRFSFKYLLLSLFCSFLLSFGLLILVSYTFYSTNYSWIFFIGLIGFWYWLYKSRDVKRIWGRTFIGLSIESLALPIAIFIFTVIFATKQSDAIQGVGAFI